MISEHVSQEISVTSLLHPWKQCISHHIGNLEKRSDHLHSKTFLQDILEHRLVPYFLDHLHAAAGHTLFCLFVP